MFAAYYDSPIGIIKIEYENSVLFGMTVVSQKGSDCRTNEFSDKVISEVSEYLDGKRRTFDIEYTLCGTDFQKRVWRELEKIPYGKTATYGEIAATLGMKKAARAVGGACNKNPIMIIVPCHRVIGTNGNPTGYALGVHLKQKLLELEKAH